MKFKKDIDMSGFKHGRNIKLVQQQKNANQHTSGTQRHLLSESIAAEEETIVWKTVN